MINTLNDINPEKEENRLLLTAIALLGNHYMNEPDASIVIAELNRLSNNMNWEEIIDVYKNNQPLKL